MARHGFVNTRMPLRQEAHASELCGGSADSDIIAASAIAFARLHQFVICRFQILRHATRETASLSMINGDERIRAYVAIHIRR